MTGPRPDQPARYAEFIRVLNEMKANNEPPEVIQYYLRTRGNFTPEEELASMPDEAPRALLGNVMAGVGTAGAALLGGVPGGQRGIAALRSLAPGISFDEAREDVKQSVGMLPAPARIGAAVVGGAATGGALARIAPAAGALLKTPVRQAAAYGGAMEALGPEKQSLKQRLAETAMGAGAGAVMAKGTEMGVNALRRGGVGLKAFFTGGRAGGTPDELLTSHQDALRAEVKPMYDAALKQGGGRAAPEPVRAVLDRPAVQTVIARLRRLERFRDLPDDDPEMVDAVYKALSDNVKRLRKPTLGPQEGPNVGRFEADDLMQTQRDLLEALGMSSSRTIPPVMGEAPGTSTAQSPPPTLRDAIEAFERKSAEVWRRNPGTETVAQRSARTALERHGAEDVVSPALSGAPQPPRPVELAPARTEPVPPFMSLYSKAVKTYAKGKGEQTAIRRGADAIDLTVQKRTKGAALGKKSPEAMERWLRTEATDAERALFEKSVRGDLGLLTRKPPASLGDWALLPLVSRAARGSAAADRMIRASQLKPRSAEIPSGVNTSTLAALLSSLGVQ